MPVITADLSEDVRRDLLARTSVLHAGRRHLKQLTDLQPRTLQGSKAVLDLLVAAHSLPPVRQSPDPVEWLAGEWATSLERMIDYTTRDDTDPNTTRELLNGLRDCLPRSAQAFPVEELFEQVCKLCASVYQDAWRRDPELRPDVSPKHPGLGNLSGRADPYSVAATTHRAAQGSATVRIEFHLPSFGPETYAVLPRLLLHECFCHAVAGHPAKQSRNDSIFAEGWMDWAAEFHFDEWIDGADPEFAQSARHHGKAVETCFAMREADGHARTHGREHAETLYRRLESEGFDTQSAKQRTAQLAVEVNLANRSLADKDELTRELSSSHSNEFWQALKERPRRSVPADVLIDMVARRRLHGVELQ